MSVFKNYLHVTFSITRGEARDLIQDLECELKGTLKPEDVRGEMAQILDEVEDPEQAVAACIDLIDALNLLDTLFQSPGDPYSGKYC
jgi:hypothetical protein